MFLDREKTEKLFQKRTKKRRKKLWRTLEKYGALQIFKGKGKYMRKVQQKMFKELYELIK